MKAKFAGLLCAAILALPTASNAELYLVDNGYGPIVVDTGVLPSGRTWLADLSLSGKVTFAGAIDWVAGLNAANYGGHNNWRFPFVSRYQDLLVDKMQNVMWFPPNRLPFLNAPPSGIIFSDSLEEGTTSCVGAYWGDWIPCVWAFNLGFNGMMFAHPNCYWDTCIAMAFHPGGEPITPSGLFAGLKLVVNGAGPGTSLSDKLALAKVYFDANDIGATCPVLAAFNREVTAQAGKKMTSYDAQWFITEVQGLMDRLGCQ